MQRSFPDTTRSLDGWFRRADEKTVNETKADEREAGEREASEMMCMGGLQWSRRTRGAIKEGVCAEANAREPAVGSGRAFSGTPK